MREDASPGLIAAAFFRISILILCLPLPPFRSAASRQDAHRIRGIEGKREGERGEMRWMERGGKHSRTRSRSLGRIEFSSKFILGEISLVPRSGIFIRFFFLPFPFLPFFFSPLRFQTGIC